MIDIGFDQYDIEIQQLLSIEVMNHEDSMVQFMSSHQSYGTCDNVRVKEDLGQAVVMV